MISLVYVPDKFVKQILNSNGTGQNMYEELCYCTHQWARYSFGKTDESIGNKMFVFGSKTTVIKFRDNMVAMNETTDLYGT